MIRFNELRVGAQENVEALLKNAQVHCQKMKIEAEKSANVIVKESEEKLKVSESQLGSMIVRAEAEGAEAPSKKRW